MMTPSRPSLVLAGRDDGAAQTGTGKTAALLDPAASEDDEARERQHIAGTPLRAPSCWRPRRELAIQVRHAGDLYASSATCARPCGVWRHEHEREQIWRIDVGVEVLIATLPPDRPSRPRTATPGRWSTWSDEAVVCSTTSASCLTCSADPELSAQTRQILLVLRHVLA